MIDQSMGGTHTAWLRLQKEKLQENGRFFAIFIMILGFPLS